MKARRILNFGVIGCGLMGREFASAAARWCHLLDQEVEPRIVAACDLSEPLTQWFADNLPHVRLVTKNYQDLLNDPGIDAIYCAVPHNLHEKLYIDIVRAGKHLLGEKPFGIDDKANAAILAEIQRNPNVLVRCSSEFPFFPGVQQVLQWIREDSFGRIIEAEFGFWHSSDLNPKKAINWKRRIDTNGEYGCMGDLGMHVVHVPLRAGWVPKSVCASLVKVVAERPDGKGGMVPCETWDNALLATQVETATQKFPLALSMKRVAPGHGNTWFLRIWGTKRSVEFSTKNPKEIRWMDYEPGAEQFWKVADLPFASAYKSITGSIFEFGFPDSMQQMWAAFCDEVVNGPAMKQPVHCATPQEAAQSHALFTAALESHKTGRTVAVEQRLG